MFNTLYCTNALLALLIFVLIRRLPEPKRFLLFPNMTTARVNDWLEKKKRKLVARFKDLAFRNITLGRK